MPIYVENGTVKKIYFEGSEIKKVYFENTQIFPSVSGPESGYWEARDFSTNFGK